MNNEAVPKLEDCEDRLVRHIWNVQTKKQAKREEKKAKRANKAKRTIKKNGD